jgi:FlaA1/EpsC-like NDP-sugar epimerase
MLLRQKSWIIALFHISLVTASFFFAWLLRYDFQIKLPKLLLLLACLPLLILSRLATLFVFNLIHGYWNHSSITDLLDIIKAVFLGSFVFIVATRVVIGPNPFHISIYVIEAMTTTAALAGVRLFALALNSKGPTRNQEVTTHRVIVIGAGDAASSLIRQIQRSEFVPVACVDDDVFKHGAKIQGVPVVDTINRLSVVVSAYDAEELFIAVPSATGSQMQHITKICEQTGLRYRTVPKLEDLLLGRVAVSQLREVNIEDLLGRDSVQLDNEVVREQITGKVVLVTGAAGSIGSELCRQLLRHSPAKLIALDQAETPLFYLQLQLTKQGGGDRVIYDVADVADARRMRQIILEAGVDIIFHAAAYKHVSMVEGNIREALRNNVFALTSLLDIAEECGCERFILISSDKAVQPTSFMGSTKRLGELILAARLKKNMRCVSVRFGNVLGSQGSVIPIFKEQIEKEGRITITDPAVTRYFMTIPEAVSLVLQAFTIGQHGDILVLDMGNPVKILDLANSLIRLSGKSPRDIRIEFIGLRPGEKLNEELFYPQEKQLPTENRKVKRTRSTIIAWPFLAAQLWDLHALSSSGSETAIRAKVKEIIAEHWHETEVDPLPIAPGIMPAPGASAFPRAFAASAGQD